MRGEEGEGRKGEEVEGKEGEEEMEGGKEKLALAEGGVREDGFVGEDLEDE